MPPNWLHTVAGLIVASAIIVFDLQVSTGFAVTGAASDIASVAGGVGDSVAGGTTVNRNRNLLNTTVTITNHICTREETYNEQLQTPSMQPVRVRTSKWCMEFPPRCSNYKTEFREVIKLQNITKTRTIRYCCDGYAGITSINETICKPICRGGCGRGYCHSPNDCSCDSGYTGKHCTQRCRHDRWGEACKNVCRCRNGSVCDNKLGICHCTSGWTGEMCELPCPHGYHGVMCRKTCECSSNRCNPQTGDCIVASDDSLIPLHPPSFTPGGNMTSTMIETLNSTIVNITHNLDRIAKNLMSSTESVTLIAVPPEIMEMTTLKSIPEVILIKPGEHHTPSIIVHQPGLGLLENIHATAAKTPEVIHVITNWQQQQSINGVDGGGQMVGLIPVNDTKIDLATIGSGGSGPEHDSTLLTTLLIILLFIMVSIAIGFLYVYRRYHYQKEIVQSDGGVAGGRHLSDGAISNAGSTKTFSKPLPDLPAFTQMLHNKIEGPDFYDSPTNNAAVKGPYCYARKESLYSVVPAKSRKGSMDSHLYDEIRYPLHGHHHHHHNHHHQPQQQQHHHHQQQQQQHHHHHQQPNSGSTGNTLTVPELGHHKISHM